MNHLLATVISGLVIDENEKYYFVQKEGHTFHENQINFGKIMLQVYTEVNNS